MNFGTAQLTPQRRAPAGPLLASVDGQVARLSDEEVVFHDPRSGENHVMTLDVLAAMDASRRFLTLEEHANRIAQRIPALKDKQHAIGKVFEFLQNRGLVVEAGAMLKQLQAEPRPVTAPAGLVIRTCDRPRELARLAESGQGDITEERRHENGGRIQTQLVRVGENRLRLITTARLGGRSLRTEVVLRETNDGPFIPLSWQRLPSREQ